MSKTSLHLFEGYGLELEYMIVDRDTFEVRPIADWLLAQVGPQGTREVEQGQLCWSNELALHVIELKGNGPVADMTTLADPLQRDIARMNELLAAQGACLMGSAVHPWMDPDADSRLWPFEDAPIYQALDRIFGCHGHGWFNLQSAHLNLPFANDEEFARLHAAIRLVLPIIPALAAASPFLDGVDTGLWDARLHVYSQHCNRLPAAIGKVIPEPVSSEQEYQDTILEPLYQLLRPLDKEGTLCYEWSNARGAIARFERNAIEVRLIDVQEHPGMDQAVVGAVAAAIRLLTDQACQDKDAMNALSCVRLRKILDEAIAWGEQAQVTDDDFLRLLCGSDHPRSAQQVWRDMIYRCSDFAGPARAGVEQLLTQGTLATRLRQVTGPVTGESLHRTAQRLCQALARGEMLV